MTLNSVMAVMLCYLI